MKFKSFLKEKIIYIILLIFAIVTSQILLMIYDINWFIRIYIATIPFLVFMIAMIMEYTHKKHFYNQLYVHMQDLKQKYLISEIIDTPDFIEGTILKDILQETAKSMTENVNAYKYLQEDYKEYIELWIHEIKLPIATSKMIIENNKTKQTKSIEEELEKIESYIEQVLFYARSNTVEKDYYITKVNLKELMNMIIVKNKSALIANKVNVKLHDLNKEVFTDNKWTIFIVNQIIQNSLKYMNKEEKEIEIFAKNQKEQVILYIQDNGIGMKKGEITKVFDKGFTGENGRMIGKKSTGIGLYLCKKLCDKLGLAIEFNSEKDIGTEVRIVFPKNSMIHEIC